MKYLPIVATGLRCRAVLPSIWASRARSPLPPLSSRQGSPPADGRETRVVSYDAITLTVAATVTPAFEMRSGCIPHTAYANSSLVYSEEKGCPKQTICLSRGTTTEICRVPPAGARLLRCPLFASSLTAVGSGQTLIAKHLHVGPYAMPDPRFAYMFEGR